VARVGACMVLMGKPEAKRKAGKPRSRWENNIRVDLKNLERSLKSQYYKLFKTLKFSYIEISKTII
jgi:hypothetical protein